MKSACNNNFKIMEGLQRPPMYRDQNSPLVRVACVEIENKSLEFNKQQHLLTINS